MARRLLAGGVPGPGVVVESFTEVGGCSGPAAERSSLLYDSIKRKRYLSSRPSLKNILELFGASFNKNRLRRSWQGGCERPGPTSGAAHSTIPVLDLVSQVRNVVLMNVYLGLGNSGVVTARRVPSK